MAKFRLWRPSESGFLLASILTLCGASFAFVGGCGDDGSADAGLATDSAVLDSAVLDADISDADLGDAEHEAGLMDGAMDARAPR